MSDENNNAMVAAVGNVDKKVTEFQTEIVKAFNQMFQHVEIMAGHIISLEAMLAAVHATHPIDTAKVEAYVRARIEDGAGKAGQAEQTLDVTRSILDRIAKA
ncbi:MAG: hypothetical protein EAZ99_12050 [Alphaproteobacteria bacterium]|nr:hypothetical protein [Alphaproteobacteria bacterium]TAD88876.1 MAG: hypothetical protein EAZ99_12050 [Alphaproteobacteria bacterium]